MLCSVGTIRGFDRDGDAIVDFQEKSGWVGLVSELERHGPVIEEVEPEIDVDNERVERYGAPLRRERTRLALSGA